MTLSLIPENLRRKTGAVAAKLHTIIIIQRPLLLYAVTWTTLLTATVMVAAFSSEIIYVSAISTSSGFSKVCKSGFRVPLDEPREILCLPDHLFRRSKLDFIVPPVFAAVVVAGSVCFVHSLALWEEPQ